MKGERVHQRSITQQTGPGKQHLGNRNGAAKGLAR